MTEFLSRNELPATRVLEICRDVNRVTPADFADVSRATSDKNAARFLKGKFGKRSSWMPDYFAQIRCWHPKTQSIRLETVPMQLPHEIVAALAKYGNLDKLMDTSNMCPLTKQHLESCEADAQAKLLAIGIWGDGAPTQWDRKESIDVLSMSLPGSADFSTLRIPMVALAHSMTCHETFDDVFAVIKWSLVALATGQWPTARHDGAPWNDTDKCRKAPSMPLPRGALAESRQDWKFAAEVFGFPAHNTGEGNCWECSCTPDKV